MLPLTEELTSYFMLDQQPLVPVDLVLGPSQRNISKQLITNSVTHFLLPLERVISKQISPWMVNVLQMEDISNTSACIYQSSQIVELIVEIVTLEEIMKIICHKPFILYVK